MILLQTVVLPLAVPPATPMKKGVPTFRLKEGCDSALCNDFGFASASASSVALILSILLLHNSGG
jgi:hypothetical protein